MRQLLALFLIIAIGLVTMSSLALAAQPGFGQLYYEGTIVRTVVPPAAVPNAGRDNFYVVTNGAAGQLGIAAVAPGAQNYHGGQWAFHFVTFNVASYLLTSEGAVQAAAAAGDVTVTRMPMKDFKCPIQP